MNRPEKRIVDFIKKHHVLTLATSSLNGESWCCNCFYAYIEDEIAFLFTSDNDTKHIQMALENPTVSGSVVLETSIIGKIQGMQFSGKLSKVGNSENSFYSLSYLKRFPFAIIKKTELWKLSLDTIKMTDNRLGFGKKLYWHRNY